ncbi:immunoglobulin-like domain-containing protein [Planomicrobium sp. YIM 101495]|uniref:immunoglobulin-like domain-containing protein n=1 Tax=Planomicrobium sp. YIM 101495 TaxID=2665160 RepID=UPI0012BA1411|nr:immunoglobulin-like domain-containing protein [Planomicrobium sp. YIM 101495]MTD31609.1 hypothetical protein [Planomicrobium sp. YIM 101495]
MKRFLYFCLFLFVLAITPACTVAQSTDSLEEESSFGDFPNEWTSEQNSIVLSSNPTAYTALVNEIIIEIENRGSETISFSHIDYVEKMIDGQWYRVPYVEGTDSIDIELVVKPGNTEVYKLETDFFDYDFTAGSYRIVKPFSFNNNSTEVMLAVEFEVESNKK